MYVVRASIYQLFDHNMRYIVPLFQRQYVWIQEKQWQPLWNDIKGKAEDYLDYQKGQGSQPSNHFLGAIVLNPTSFQGLQVPGKLIVDGQQRLTTLQIILLALRDYARSIEHTRIQQNIEYQVANHGSMEHSFEVYKVWPTNADQKIYEDIFKAGSKQKLLEEYPLTIRLKKKKPEPRPRLVEAYLFYFEAIHAFATMLNTSDENPINAQQSRQVIFQRLDALEIALKQYLEIVQIDLDEKDNPQIIFETLNYRGEPLTPSDLIRNFVFLEVTNQKKPVEEYYKRYWYMFDQPDANGNQGFWKEQEQAGRYFVQRMDLFVFNYLSLQTQREISMGRLYQEFIDRWKKKHLEVETELDNFKAYCEIFQEFYQPDISTRRGIFERRLRIMDLSTLYPLLMYLFKDRKEDFSEQDETGVIIDLESYLVRRMVCDLSTKNYNKFFLSMLSILSQKGKLDRKAVQDILLQSDAEASRWPSNDMFKSSWESKPLYSMLQRGRVKLILEALDQQLLTNKQEGFLSDYSKTSIEHIMPQSWSDSYPLPPGIRPSDENAIVARENILHTIGNLTLLTQPLNSTISNGPFKDKRLKIAEQSMLRLNVDFQEQNLRMKNEWIEQDILNRGKKLFEIAQTIWPYPTVS